MSNKDNSPKTLKRLMAKNIGVIIIGATGYGAKEFLRLSESHPNIEIVQVISQSRSNISLREIHPNLNRFSNLKTEQNLNFKLLDKFEHKFIILTLPSDSSADFIHKYGAEANKLNIHLIDFSGCCRLKNQSSRNIHYPESSLIEEHELKKFQFGLPELFSTKINSAINISNPGCYATAGILSVAPIKNFKISSLIMDGKSGSSGAGKTLNENFHHPELSSNVFAYKIGIHRHQAEIAESLELNNQNFLFCPHVIPISRGMMVTTYLTLEERFSTEEILNLFNNFYKSSYFVKISENPPKISSVAGSNFCKIHITIQNNLIVIVSVLDNLIKGMAGQAIQNINLMSDLEEQIGLEQPAIGLI